MLHPVYKLQLGSLSLDPESSDDLIDINVKLSMDSAPGNFQGLVRKRDGEIGFAKNDPVSVSLGYNVNDNNELTDVFAGTVDSFNLQSSNVRVTALSSFIKLYNLSVNRFYENQTAGAIVKDLADSVGIEIETVSDGIELPYYAVGGNKTAYENIIELAQICGFDFYSTNEAKLVFKKHEAKEPHLLEYGKNIIRIRRVDQSPSVDSVKVFGTSPSGSKGRDVSHWLTKKNIQGSSGDGSNQLLVQNKAIRSEDSAKKVAEAILNRMKSLVVIKVETIGNPKIMLGNTVKVQGVPEESLNGEFQVREIEHYLSKSDGFITMALCRSIVQ